ncbi:hypothetical protein GINT2_000835 [Glugoides intestinalis]
MKIFISETLFPNRKVITDDHKEENYKITDQIQLVFIDGSVTIKVFKHLYRENIDAYFVVRNLEYFISKMMLFRNVPMEVVKKADNAKKTSLPPLAGYNNLFPASKPFKNMVKKYINIETSLGGTDTSRGVEVSFRPRIFDSIHSSLEDSSLYLSSDMLCHKIYKVLKNRRASIEEVEKIDKNKDNVHKTLKSMLHSGIICKKDEEFCLNDFFHIKPHGKSKSETSVVP